MSVMHSITVKQQRHKIVYEEKEVTFPSKADPPVKCCRCFPNLVNKDGFCGCCFFDHTKGERECADPDPLEPI